MPAGVDTGAVNLTGELDLSTTVAEQRSRLDVFRLGVFGLAAASFAAVLIANISGISIGDDGLDIRRLPTLSSVATATATSSSGR